MDQPGVHRLYVLLTGVPPRVELRVLAGRRFSSLVRDQRLHGNVNAGGVPVGIACRAASQVDPDGAAAAAAQLCWLRLGNRDGGLLPGEVTVVSGPATVTVQVGVAPATVALLLAVVDPMVRAMIGVAAYTLTCLLLMPLMFI